MNSWDQFTTNRYRPLQTNLTDTLPLIIDTEANPQDILEAARSIDDLRPSVSEEEARRIFAAKRDAIRQRAR